MCDIYVKSFAEECLLGQAAKEIVELTTPRRAAEPLVPPDGRRAAHIHDKHSLQGIGKGHEKKASRAPHHSSEHLVADPLKDEVLPLGPR